MLRIHLGTTVERLYIVHFLPFCVEKTSGKESNILSAIALCSLAPSCERSPYLFQASGAAGLILWYTLSPS
jgi:hypothetical protein